MSLTPYRNIECHELKGPKKIIATYAFIDNFHKCIFDYHTGCLCNQEPWDLNDIRGLPSTPPCHALHHLPIDAAKWWHFGLLDPFFLFTRRSRERVYWTVGFFVCDWQACFRFIQDCFNGIWKHVVVNACVQCRFGRVIVSELQLDETATTALP